MPKYYRFRALTPTRKPKRRREREKDIDKVEVERVDKREKLEKLDSNWMNSITLECTPGPAWYLRRIAWRQPLMGLPRQLSSTLRASNRPIFVLKMPVSGFIRM